MMGYLVAVPSGSKDSCFKSWATSLPDPGPLSYLWEWLTQMGVIIGGREISYPDIKAWSGTDRHRINRKKRLRSLN